MLGRAVVGGFTVASFLAASRTGMLEELLTDRKFAAILVCSGVSSESLAAEGLVFRRDDRRNQGRTVRRLRKQSLLRG